MSDTVAGSLCEFAHAVVPHDMRLQTFQVVLATVVSMSQASVRYGLESWPDHWKVSKFPQVAPPLHQGQVGTSFIPNSNARV